MISFFYFKKLYHRSNNYSWIFSNLYMTYFNFFIYLNYNIRIITIDKVYYHLFINKTLNIKIIIIDRTFSTYI